MNNHWIPTPPNITAKPPMTGMVVTVAESAVQRLRQRELREELRRTGRYTEALPRAFEKFQLELSLVMELSRREHQRFLEFAAPLENALAIMRPQPPFDNIKRAINLMWGLAGMFLTLYPVGDYRFIFYGEKAETAWRLFTTRSNLREVLGILGVDRSTADELVRLTGEWLSRVYRAAVQR